jgi:putative ABC transport system permease protein
MLIPNLKIAQRSLVRNKLYTVINIAGLSVSLAACLLIALFVRDETSFDRQFKDYERIYRLGGNYQQGGDERIADAATTFLLHPLIEEKVSGIESVGRIDFDIQTISINDKDYVEEVVYVDSTFFDIFSLPFSQGDPASTLDEPSNVVIDKQTALKFFDDANPIGKSILMKDKLFTVSGVMEDMPGTRTLKLISFSLFLESNSFIPIGSSQTFQAAVFTPTSKQTETSILLILKLSVTR